MKIQTNILEILAECTTNGYTVYLPNVQLERNIYTQVNKCLESIGGKWNRKAKGHVFDSDPSELLENLLVIGEFVNLKKEFQFFPTPREVAETVCDMAELTAETYVLEPSCGKGDLADVIYERTQNLICNELNRDMQKHLSLKPYTCIYGNFLSMQPKRTVEFDRIVMNPPFSKQQDIDHVYHAYSLLKSGGIMVSVMFPSSFFRTNNKSIEFRAWLNEHCAEVHDVPIGAFKTSGTMIETKIVKVRKA